MKRILLVLVATALLGLILFSLTGAQCPQDTVDLGTCDTLYIECYDCDSIQGPPPWNVHLLLSVTHDLAISTDSIKGFIIPLSYDGDCSFPVDSNTTDLSGPGLSRSIFRDFGGRENRMLDLEQLGGGKSWDSREIEINNYDGHFFISLSASGAQDRKWWGGSKVLLATLTLTVTDTTIVYIDTTFWPDEATSLHYTRLDNKSYLPRLNSPGCFWFAVKPGDINSDGHVGLGDVIYLADYYYRAGPAPRYRAVADVSGDGIASVGDIVWLINYLCNGSWRPRKSCWGSP